MIILSATEPDPFTPVEKVEKKAEPAAKGKDKEASPAPAASGTKIDIAGIMQRTIPLEGVEAGSYFRLEALDGGCLFLSQEKPAFENCYTTVTDTTEGTYDLVHWSFKDKKTTDGIKGINNYHLSADKKKIVYKAGGKFGIIDAPGKGNVGDGSVDLAQAKFKIDFLDEFPQIFNEAWRIQRDWFYDVNMHGVDWPAVRDHYLPYVKECGTRNDLNYLIGEMIGELNIGHTYVWGGDIKDEAKKMPVTLLGCDLDFSGAYPRIKKILRPSEADPQLKSALALTPAKDGDYIISVDKVDAGKGKNFYSLFENKTGWTEIAVNDKPQAEGARKFFVKPLRAKADSVTGCGSTRTGRRWPRLPAERSDTSTFPTWANRASSSSRGPTTPSSTSPASSSTTATTGEDSPRHAHLQARKEDLGGHPAERRQALHQPRDGPLLTCGPHDQRGHRLLRRVLR